MSTREEWLDWINRLADHARERGGKLKEIMLDDAAFWSLYSDLRKMSDDKLTRVHPVKEHNVIWINTQAGAVRIKRK